jgi:aspartate aminotransferase/aminotransferase
MVIDFLGDVTELVIPEGAFYAFPKIPTGHNMCGMEFISKAIENDVLVIQGDVFSKHDTHFRLSFAVPEDKLELGLTTLKTLLS